MGGVLVMPEAAAKSSALKVFISYSQDDGAFAKKLVEALKTRGLDPKIDTQNLPALEDWQRELLGFIREADAVVFIISPRSIESKACKWEVEQVAALNKRLAPIVLERVEDDRIPPEISKIQYLFFDSGSDFEAKADDLAAALQSDIGWVKEHTRLGERARLWNEGRKSSSLQLRGEELLGAEAWIASRPRSAPDPTDLHKQFIKDSRKGTTRRRNLLVTGLSGGLVVALSLAAVALWQRSIAIDQRAQVIAREMDRRAALAQDIASQGRARVASAVALDALRGAEDQKTPTAALRAAILRTLDLVKIPVEHFIGENVFNLTLSPDGMILAAGTNTSKVYILDTATLEERFVLDAGEDVISGLRFSPDGRRLVSSGDKVPEVWDVATGKKLFDLVRPNAKRSVYQVHFSPAGDRILATTNENQAYIHDASNGKLLQTLQGATYDEMRDRYAKSESADGFGVADPIVDAVNRATFTIWGSTTEGTFSPDGKLVAVTGAANPDGSVRLFDVKSGKLVRTLTGGRGASMLPPLGYGSKLSFSPDGSTLVAAPLEQSIKIWNVADGKLRREFAASGVNSFVLTADGEALVSAHNNGAVIFRCLGDNATIVSLQAHDGGIDSLSVDGEGKLLATGATDRTARVWRMPKGREVCADDRTGEAINALSVMKPTATLEGHGARITKAVFSSDRSKLYTASQDGWVRAWSIGSVAAANEFVLPGVEEPENSWDRPDRDAVVSANGQQIFLYDEKDYKWLGWTIATGKPLEVPEKAEVIVSGTSDGAILFRSPTKRLSLGPNPESENGFDFSYSSWKGPASPNGTRVVATEKDLSDKDGAGEIPLLVDSSTGQSLATLAINNEPARDVIFSRDSTRLLGRIKKAAANADEKESEGLAVWDGTSGRMVGHLPSIDNLSYNSPIRMSDDGKLVLALTGTNNLDLFDVSGTEPKGVDLPDFGTRFGSGRQITAGELSPDGKLLLVGRSDGAVAVVDIARASIWRILDTNRLPVRSIAQSSDGQYVAATDISNTVWIFDVMSGDLVRSVTFVDRIDDLDFVPGAPTLIATTWRGVKLFPATPRFENLADLDATVGQARKFGLNLVSLEDRRRYRLGDSALSEEAVRVGSAEGEVKPEGAAPQSVAVDRTATRTWAALDPNSEGTAPVVWAKSAEEAQTLAKAACAKVSETCASQAATTDDLESTFVYYCCEQPKVGCAVYAGTGDDALRSVKQILAKAKYSKCEVKSAVSAATGLAE
ncbi:MAG: TIR domain-containing protein [Hyphomicrobium sp.]|nr:TIR domain-containing protein [Hyphomicrobium sp.]